MIADRKHATVAINKTFHHRPTVTVNTTKTDRADYVLDRQAGFLMRLAGQRHAVIFQSLAPLDLTPTQFSAVIRLLDLGECSQNELGRQTAMDVATIKGVVDRLRKRGLVEVRPDPADKRRSLISLAAAARALEDKLHAAGHRITEETLRPLTASEQRAFLALLSKLT